MAMYFGRRPIFVIASFGFFGTGIWCATATSFNSLVAARVLVIFFGSCSEGLAAAIVADLFFLHERARWMAVYIFFLVNGTTFGSIVSGFTITDLGWRWHHWVSFLDRG